MTLIKICISRFQVFSKISFQNSLKLNYQAEFSCDKKITQFSNLTTLWNLKNCNFGIQKFEFLTVNLSFSAFYKNCDFRQWI